MTTFGAASLPSLIASEAPETAVTDFAILGTVVSLIVVPITGMLVWLFKHVFETYVPTTQKNLEASQLFWSEELRKERELFKSSLEALHEDFKSFQETTSKSLSVMNETLLRHQEHIETLLRKAITNA
jgi:hypothetical protein